MVTFQLRDIITFISTELLLGDRSKSGRPHLTAHLVRTEPDTSRSRFQRSNDTKSIHSNGGGENAVS